MDLLLGVEPQLAIPVVGVVFCALLVYVFGFQKTQEPSFQHLAILQATGKANRAAASLRQRSSTPQVKTTTKAKDKVVANGHAVQEKSSPKANGTAKPVKGKDVSNKENVKPQVVKGTPKKEKVTSPAPEDLESGDWIQAVSRKDKKKVVVEKTPKPKKETKPREVAQVKENVIAQVLKDVTVSQTTQAEAPVKEVVTPTKPAKESKKKSESGSSNEASPKKQAKTEPVVVAPVKEPAPQKAKKENVEPKVEVVKETPVSPPVVEKDTPADPRSNVAFDEMGDAWEEAKSRGTKKRRARKD